jgi:hypothetical protein
MKLDSQTVTELQKQILQAALPRSEQITPICVSRRSPGSLEVKIGEHRLFGEGAVAAVVDLVVQGLLNREAAGHFVLTRQGINLARSIEGLAPLPRNQYCAKCNTRLKSSYVRCPKCGIKVTVIAAPAEMSPKDGSDDG